ncbi:MAG TPA: hypothetical protein PLX16_06795 [Exilispira sp.]|nr:hypothetical protein [Exilispira sp.]
MNINPNPEAPQYKSGFSNIKNYILYNLGYPVVRVELTEEQIITCIIDALTLFTKYCGEIEYKLITVNTLGINYVEIPDDPDYQSFPTPDPDPFNPAPPVNQTAVKLRHTSIVDVVFTATTLDRLGKALMTGGLAGGFEDYSLPLNSYLSGGSSYISDFDITSYYLYIQKLEDFKKTIGLKQMWEILNNKIELLREYLFTLNFLLDLDPFDIGFVSVFESSLSKITFLIDEIKQYEKIYQSISKSIELKDSMIYQSKIDEQKSLINSINSTIEKVIIKYEKEKENVKMQLDNIKPLNSNPMQESEYRYFEKKV